MSHRGYNGLLWRTTEEYLIGYSEVCDLCDAIRDMGFLGCPDAEQQLKDLLAHIDALKDEFEEKTALLRAICHDSVGDTTRVEEIKQESEKLKCNTK